MAAKKRTDVFEGTHQMDYTIIKFRPAMLIFWRDWNEKSSTGYRESESSIYNLRR
jgi:hypothetical protein